MAKKLKNLVMAAYVEMDNDWHNRMAKPIQEKPVVYLATPVICKRSGPKSGRISGSVQVKKSSKSSKF